MMKAPPKTAFSLCCCAIFVVFTSIFTSCARTPQVQNAANFAAPTKPFLAKGALENPKSEEKSHTHFAKADSAMTLELLSESSSERASENAVSSEASPPGFLFSVGGGASTGNDGSAKPAQVEIHRAALKQLQWARKMGATAGVHACIVEYHEDNADTASTIAVVKQLFVAAGKADAEIRGYVIDSAAKADNAKVANEISKDCGIVFFPGGDQTQMRDLWKGSLAKKAFEEVVRKGGGIMGKSAGAALQGSIGYFPADDADPSAGALAINARVSRSEFGLGFFSLNLKGLPPFYVETHAGDRERTARALTLLATWEALQKNSTSLETAATHKEDVNKSEPAVAIVVDSDTGVLIRFDPLSRLWIAEVYGARVAEFLSPTAKSKIGIDSNNQPFTTDFSTHALLSGAKLVLSGAFRGTVVAHNASLPTLSPGASCLSRLPTSVNGKYDSDATDASQLTFDALNPATGEATDFNSVEYAYLSGGLLLKKGSGCGYWLSNSLNPDYGRPENRLNAQRYALGLGLTSFSVALPPSMEARANSNRTTLNFNARVGKGSSSLIYDVSKASRRSVGTYIYKELGHTKPLQVAGWESGAVHLLPAGSSFDLVRMTILR